MLLTYRYSFRPVVVPGLLFGELDDDWTDLVLDVQLVDQALLQEDQQGRLRRLPHLVVVVCQELDHHGQQVLGHHVEQARLELLAVHGDVGHLLHQLSTHVGLCANQKQTNLKCLYFLRFISLKTQPEDPERLII